MFVDKCKGRSVRDRDNFVDNLGADLPGRLMYSICYSIFLYAISHIFIHHRTWLSLLTTGRQTCLADKRVVEMFARDLPSKMIISIFFWVLIFFCIFTIPNIFIIIIDIFLRCCDKHLKIIFILYLIDDHYHYHYLMYCGDVRERPAVEDEHH